MKDGYSSMTFPIKKRIDSELYVDGDGAFL